MTVLHVALRWFHDLLTALAGVWRWVVTPFWMRKMPPFCKDWGILPIAPPRAGDGPPPPVDAVNGGLLGIIVAATIPAEAILPVLPRGVVFAPGVKLTDPYPISIAFGLQHRVGSARFPKLPGANYLEFAVGVADLRLQDPVDGFSGPCGILGRLDLNELLPIVLGRLLGLQKVLRLVRTDENAFGVRSFWFRSTVAYGALHQKNEPQAALATPGLAPILRTFAQPIVSRSMFGTLAFTRFTWHWDQGLARETPCDLTIDEGLAHGQYAYSPNRPSANCTGAWQIRVPWTMEAFQSPSSFVTASPAATKAITPMAAAPVRRP